MELSEVKALTFDVFGTVVDWRGSIISEGEDVWAAKGVDVDWAKFADSWRAGYGPGHAPCSQRRASVDQYRCPAPHDSG